MTVRPIVKGWCPGAFRPMMSGDGLIVRVRPRQGRLTAKQISDLATLSTVYGSGTIDLTSRANLQIRGVTEAGYEPLLNGLLDAELIDQTAEIEARRNILVAPFEHFDGAIYRVHDQIVSKLDTLPDLPAKMGIALDTGSRRFLPDASADFRFERGENGRLLLRADGAVSGVWVAEEDATIALQELAHWFLKTGGKNSGRMRRHLNSVELPAAFQGAVPCRQAAQPEPGRHNLGFLLGAAFGVLDAKALKKTVSGTKTKGVRFTPWRMFLLEGVEHVKSDAFIRQSGDPLLAAFACPGAPFCTQAEVETRTIAKALAPRLSSGKKLHVSGCAKSCALPKNSDVTLVGRGSKFDIVRNGAAWDEPVATGLSADEAINELVQE